METARKEMTQAPADWAGWQRLARRLGVQGLLQVVADAYDVPATAILSRNRLQQVCRARQMLYLVLHDYLHWHHKAIARHLGRDATSVTYGVQRAAAYREAPDGRYDWEHIAQQILARAGRGQD